MGVEFKKLRVMWKEQLEVGNGEDIDFQVSFDEGKRWVSFKDILQDIRTPSTNGRRIPLASYEMIDDIYSSIDFTIPLTFNSIPGFSDKDSTITSYDDDSEFGFPAGSYFIKVSSISTDFVGMNQTETRVSAMSSISKSKRFDLPTRGDMNVAVQFEDGTKGLAFYLGKTTRLVFETPITVQTHTAVFTDYSVNEYSDMKIPIEQGSIFGSSYITSSSFINSKIIKADSTEIPIDETMIESISINEKNRLSVEFKQEISLIPGDSVIYCFDVDHYRLLFVSNLTTKLVKAIERNSSEPILIDNRYPLAFSGRIRVNSEYIIYTNSEFETSAEFPEGYYKLTGITRESITARHEVGSPVMISLLDGGIFGELPKKSITIYESTSDLNQYYHFDSNAASGTVIDMTGKNNGTIIGTVDFSNTESFLKSASSFNKAGIIVTKYDFKPNGTIHFYFKIDAIPDSDMYLFGNRNGLWMKVSKDNLRISVGFGPTTIINNENPKLSKIKIGEWTEIGLSWQISSTFDSRRMYLYNNGSLEVDESFNFEPSSYHFAIGGLLTSNIVNDDYSEVTYDLPYKGKLDDWRIYDSALSLDDIINLDSSLKNLGFEYCGIVNLDKRFVNRSDNPAIKDQILDYSLYDGNLLKYEPYVTSYFSILKDDVEEIDSLGEYSTVCDLWPLYAIDNGNLFTTDLIDEIIVDNKMNGNLILKNDGIPVPRISYPINVNTLKYRFTLSGKSDGISSPVLKDFATIVSTSIIDFD